MVASEFTIESGERLRSEIHLLALERIRYLEQEILDKFGMKIRCAIEMEFFALRPDGKTPRQFLSGSTHIIDTEAHTPTKGREKNGIPNFDNSPYVESVRRETKPATYEIVLDSTRWMKGGIMYFRHASEMAKSAAAVRRLIEKKTPELYNGIRRLEARFIPRNPRQKSATAGMHVNVSLWDAEQKTNLFSDKKLLNIAQKGSLLVQEKLLPLVIESSESLRRYGSSRLTPKFFGWDNSDAEHFNHKFNRLSLLRRFSKTSKNYHLLSDHDLLEAISELDAKQIRLENRLPGSDADPALAVLMSVAGLHYGLTHRQKLEDSIWQPKSIVPESSRPEEALLRRFQKNEQARELLGEDLFGKIVEYRKLQYQHPARSRH